MTLQEYLIKLGFSTDEPSFKKFIDTVSQAGAVTAEAGSIALETAAGIEVMVSRIARQYEALYYVSQRTGQSVRYIQSTQYAFSQIGLSADDATQAIEGFGATMRTQPWLKALPGVGANVQQTIQNWKNSGIPYFIANQFAQQLNIPENVLLHDWKFGDSEAKAAAEFKTRQRNAGIDPDAFAKRISEPKPGSFIWSLNRLENDLDIFGQRMAIDFVDPVQKGIDAVDSLVQSLNNLDAKSGGWLGFGEGIAGTGAASWLVTKVLKRVFKGKIPKAAANAAEGAAVVGGEAAIGVGGEAAITAEAGAAAFGWPLILGLGAALGVGALGYEGYRLWNKSGSSGGGGARGDRNNNPGNIKYGKFAVAHGAIGSDGTFAIFPDKKTGEIAMAGLLHSQYSGLNLAQIQRKWVGNVDPNYLASMERSTGLGPSGIPDLNKNDVVANLIAGMARGEGSHLGGGLSKLLAQQGGGGTTNNVTVNSKTEINLNGTAGTAAGQIAAAQDKVSQGTARNVLAGLR